MSAQNIVNGSAGKARMRVAVLGSTGSIGLSTLDVLSRHPDRFEVFALTANSNVARLREQCLAHRPRFAVMVDAVAAARLTDELRSAGSKTHVLAGQAALSEVAAHEDVDAVMAAIVGAAGLRSSLAAARAGKRIMLANKEALVMSGPLFMQAVREGGATLLPVDSEHNAVFQCMSGPGATPAGVTRSDVRRVLLTASGGPFLRTPASALRTATPEQACAHPRWVMGRKISVDSATLMNKGLEVIEAHQLFGLPGARIDVVVHPQSLVHSLVEFADGSTLAQLGLPDMRTALAVGLGWPGRIASGVEGLDLLAHGRLDFEAPDRGAFPCLGLAYAALEAGGTAPAVLNAANEVAVSSFLQGRIGFLSIPALVEACLEALPPEPASSLDVLLAADAQARALAQARIATGTLSP